MSDLVCITYDKMDTADNVLTELQKLEVEHLTDLEDACVLVRDDKRKEHLKQAVNLVGMGTASGATWGGLFGQLVGLLFLNPLMGWAAGLVKRRLLLIEFNAVLAVDKKHCPPSAPIGQARRGYDCRTVPPPRGLRRTSITAGRRSSWRLATEKSTLL